MGSSPMQTRFHPRPGQDIRTLRVLTYNVHSCRGGDRKHDPARIADVIAASEPDIIALQELDVGRLRTGQVDQAEVIAGLLNMRAHFHPALHVEEEKYGDAILTALPSRVIKAGALPSIGEPRGAIWIEIELGQAPVQIINTHLGLRRRERIVQSKALVGPDWAGSERCRTTPTLMLGDFNSVPGSEAYRTLLSLFRPALPASGKRLKPTFPARVPILRLDHVFVNDHAAVVDIEAVDTPASRRASDHLPLLATVEIDIAAAIEPLEENQPRRQPGEADLMRR